MKKTLVILLLAFSFFSCGVDPCDYDCSEGPIGMRLVLLDKKSEKNMFETGIFARKELMIFSDGEPMNFIWLEPKNRITLDFFEETGSYSYQFRLGDIHFDLDFSVVEIEEKCCSNFHFENESVSKGEIEKSESGVYQIKIETE